MVKIDIILKKKLVKSYLSNEFVCSKTNFSLVLHDVHNFFLSNGLREKLNLVEWIRCKVVSKLFQVVMPQIEHWLPLSRKSLFGETKLYFG